MSTLMSLPRSPVFHVSTGAARASEASAALPEWNLDDLYPAIDAPEVTADLARVDAECVAFEETYKGKLAAIAASPEAGEKLGAAVKRFETIGELLGRLGSFAGLLYAGNTADPKRAQFFGDLAEKNPPPSSHPL